MYMCYITYYTYYNVGEPALHLNKRNVQLLNKVPVFVFGEKIKLSVSVIMSETEKG